MAWLESIDAALFRLLNVQCSHPFLDSVVPFFSGNRFFVPGLTLLAIGLLWKGGRRGRTFVLLLAIIIALGDGLVINALKHVVGRARPFFDLADARVLVGRTDSGSMPSSHAATWFAATFVAYVFYRRSWRFLLPIACLVGYSRIYVGVHYPGDVAAGAILGAGYAAAGLVGLDALWRWAGRRWFPLWWRRLPTLVDPNARLPGDTTAASPGVAVPGAPATSTEEEHHWLRLGYLLIAVLFLARLGYLASGRIDLSEDEAYQWTWSKHLALSYYSKPPLIAYLQWMGTHLWGDTAFGVRFGSPVLAALLSGIVLRFMAREFHARLGCLLVIVSSVTPLLAVGATLMTIDPPLVLFWTAAMVAGWRAAQPGGSTRDWLWVGLWMGLAFLAKYSALYQLFCFGVFFALWPPARAHLRRAGPWLALVLTLVCMLPVVVWNARHGWVTVGHVASHAGLQSHWQPTLRYLGEFLGAEALVLNPVFFVAALRALAAFGRRQRADGRLVFLFSMGAPVVLGHLLYSLHSRILPNWIAPAVIPMFCYGAIVWDERWRRGESAVKGWVLAGLGLGLVAVVLLHDTRLVGRLTGHTLPAEADVSRRVRSWRETAQVVAEARDRLLAEGKPVFIIADHYGMTGELSFYLNEARATIADRPLVYHRFSLHPENQFYFWPGYRDQRRGQNALFVRALDAPRRPLRELGAAMLRGDTGLPRPDPAPAPVQLRDEFESVTDLGVYAVVGRGRVDRWLQLFACRTLR